MFGFDPLYFLFLSPALVLMLWAQFRVKSAFNKYSRVRTSSGMSGAEAAREILRANGISDVRVEQVQGFLSDHYDPTKKVLRLSPDVYQSTSAASVGIAAHEVGHAIQHAHGYGPLALRTAIVPAVQIGSFLWAPLFFIGLFFSVFELAMIGLIAFAGIAVFQLVTLPVEFDASRRAIAEVGRLGIVRGDEIVGTRRVLNAAALTYVAAAIQSLLTILYLLMRMGLLGRRSD
ncbi:zinc metallopeptidase [Candidatus Poribacteria bacterium]|nr:zinc metallopeptidase [Candidatus Poribacteria bacterium]